MQADIEKWRCFAQLSRTTPERTPLFTLLSPFAVPPPPAAFPPFA